MTASEQRIEDALHAMASGVQTSPDAYRQVQGRWRRRERRRRLVVAALATAVIVAANGIALWALSDAPPEQHIIFNDPSAR